MSFHGILDLSGKTPFVRPGYRPAPGDVALPLSLVRKHKLRPGDEVTGTTEEITSVNGAAPGEPRPCFADLVPVHPDRRLLLETTPARLLPNGAFYNDTGGSWVFVVSPDGTRAIKRQVRLGRRNQDFIEVLDGLDPGEKVITSPYTGFADKDRLDITK